jgi:hypothetical protein
LIGKFFGFGTASASFVSMSIIPVKVKRSKLYHAITMTRPVEDAWTNRLDFWGSVIVPFLCVAVVALVRVFCTH